ncbi:hypothetical protein OAA32_00010 [bacterium]|jgi:hypothetical protein|nr:hypothetical protein [bacterium]
MKLHDDDIDVKYLNGKIESLSSALFDSIHEFEERLKQQEKKIIELNQQLKNESTKKQKSK